jgi:hypothetical protein
MHNAAAYLVFKAKMNSIRNPCNKGFNIGVFALASPINTRRDERTYTDKQYYYVCSELRCNESTVECIANTVDKNVLRNHSEA